MDLFTHVLLAYLLTYGIVGAQPAYLAAGALAGGLPDADVLFFPIARRFPILRHHGITHSIFGVTVVAVAGAVVAPMLAPGSPLIYFAVMEAGGLAHVLGDGFTHFSVPPLLPFSNAPLEMDADRAINFLTLGVSVASFYLLLGVERNHVPFVWYTVTVYGLMAFYAAYIAIRLAGRYLDHPPPWGAGAERGPDPDRAIRSPGSSSPSSGPRSGSERPGRGTSSGAGSSPAPSRSRRARIRRPTPRRAPTPPPRRSIGRTRSPAGPVV